MGEGELVSVIGPNGSGKTTLFNLISGLDAPDAGTVTFEGRGIGSVPESHRVFGTMTVRENVLMGAYTRSDAHAVAEDYEGILDLFPKLRGRHAQQAGTLSGGEQQMVAMARALMGRPRLIVMDEPTMGLSPLHVDRVLEMIQTINRRGVSIFMVEQNASLARDPQIRDAYLGGAQAA
ncbi:Branched-chain amino acid ABC transporter, ATP-binding protein LivF (TC 3.A.1.4.1) [Azospirillum endophyticum]